MEEELAVRLLPLEGGVNFRDLGGYATGDGRKVKWRRLYRSGLMSRLTTSDHSFLAERNIRTVIDFRRTAEQHHEPNPLAQTPGVSYWSRDYDEVFGHLAEMASRGISGVAEARQIMIDGYRHLPFQQAEAYAEMFRRIAAGEVPLVFHCTAGKDRTGGAAALILSVLGVPRETILADFNMTERAVDLRKALGPRPAAEMAKFASIPLEVSTVIGGAHPDFMAAMLDTVAERCGSVEGYLGELGLNKGDIEAVRGELLE